MIHPRPNVLHQAFSCGDRNSSWNAATQADQWLGWWSLNLVTFHYQIWACSNTVHHGRCLIEASISAWQPGSKETEREGSKQPLQEHTPGDMPSTASHLLKVPPPPNSTSDQGPSLHHRGPWRTLQTHTWH